MKHINTAGNTSNIEIVFEIPTNELVKETLTSTVLSRLPDEYRDKVFFSDFVNYDKFPKVSQLPNVKLVVSPDSRWAEHLPHVQYTYDSKALFLAIELEKLEKALLKVIHFLKHGEFPITQVERKGFYPRTKEEVQRAFAYLHKYPVLGADIEGTSLKFYKNKLVSISFAVSESKGFTFHVKRCDFEEELVKFFKKYQGRIVWHNGSYDVKALAFLYFDSDSRELFRTYEDTMFLHFMCTNSPERPERNLGALAEDLCGSYKLSKKEITDMMNVDVAKVCRYNLDDARGTFWLYGIYRSQIYSEYFYEKLKKWQWCLTQMELTGLPYKVEDLKKATKHVEGELKRLVEKLTAHPLVAKTLDVLQQYELEKYNASHVGQKELYEIPRKKFNPRSPTQVKILFETVIGVKSPLLTKTGNPSYGVKAYPHLKLAVSDNKLAISMMDLLEEHSGYNQLYVTFLKPMLGNSWVKPDGTATLHGSFNLARVVSGRLSSSDPNLQNLPSKGSLGKIFKAIITAPAGWIMGASDYASLEERVNTILTGDPNKRAVYIDGYDGHSYRAYYYFMDDLPEITEKLSKASTEQEKIDIINSIKEDYEVFRDNSKAPTFLLQYLGTAYGLRLTCGFPLEQALAIERNYHQMYSVSDEWLKARLEQAADLGYAEVAYGLRVYCTAISKSILNSKYTPKIVSKHIRTIGNAFCQSYGQLTVDAGMKFLTRVYEAGLQDRVKLTCTIHDALYPMWEDDLELTKWVNDNLVECMEDISELPELQGDIPLISDLEYFAPSWAKCKPLPKFGSLEEIEKALKDD